MIQGVLFDLDGTLLDRDSSLALFLGQQFDRFAASLSGVDRDVFVRTVADLDAHGHVPKSKVYRELIRTFEISHELADTLLADFEARFHSIAIPLPGMNEMLRKLAADGFRMGLVTNGLSGSQRPKIESLGIAGCFTTILVSEERGLRKPDRAIFELALRELGLGAEQTVFVGDHPESDIGGASRAGMRTIWLRNPFWGVPDGEFAVVDELHEIPVVLRQWNHDERSGSGTKNDPS